MNILPREKLTEKAKSGIYIYVLWKLKSGEPLHLVKLIRYTLEAERMRRSDLYIFLEKHGYRWNGVCWVEK
jgi:hypothetical protein